MPNKNMIRETMQSMHASDDLYERVMERATHPSRRRRRGAAMPLAAVAGLVVAATVAAGGSAYAIMNIQPGAPLLDRIWDDNGLGDRVDWVHDETGDHMSMTFSSIDPNQLGSDFINAEQEVGMTVEANGYTLLVESMMIDANGCGAVTMVLSNPNGISYSPQYGMPGELVLNGDDDPGLSIISMVIGTGPNDFANTRLIYNVETAEDTRMELVMYFDLAENSAARAIDEGVSWCLGWDGAQGSEDAFTDVFYPEQVVGSLDLSDGDSHASITPFSLRLAIEEYGESEVVSRLVAIELVDGSEIIVEDDDNGVVNFYTDACSDDRKTTACTFTQPIDTSQVKAVRFEGDRYIDHGRTRETVSRRFTID